MLALKAKNAGEGECRDALLNEGIYELDHSLQLYMSWIIHFSFK
jgi:hypothetical protein